MWIYLSVCLHVCVCVCGSVCAHAVGSICVRESVWCRHLTRARSFLPIPSARRVQPPRSVRRGTPKRRQRPRRPPPAAAPRPPPTEGPAGRKPNPARWRACAGAHLAVPGRRSAGALASHPGVPCLLGAPPLLDNTRPAQLSTSLFSAFCLQPPPRRTRTARRPRTPRGPCCRPAGRQMSACNALCL